MKRIMKFAALAVMFFYTGCSGINAPEKISPTDSAPENTVEITGTEKPKEEIVIKMAIHTSVSQEVSSAVRAFNESDNGYKIEFVDYDEYDDAESYTDDGALLPGGWEKADFELQMDILKGDTVHLVPDTAFSDRGKFDLLMVKSAFIDLYSFLDRDGEINRDTLDTHVLELCETDGKLCYLPQYYWIETMFGKTEYVGEKEGWTFAELKDRWNAMPDDATFNLNVDKHGVYRVILRNNLGAFLDYENGTCSFDSPEFVDMLEFCNSFILLEEKETVGGDRKKFVMDMMLCGFNEYHRILTWEDDDDYTLVGYPTEDGNGAFLHPINRYAICADAPPEVQEGAWEFIRTLMEEEFCCEQCNKYNGLLGFPVNRAAYERLAQEELHRPKEEQYSYGNMTQEEYKRLCDYIGRIDAVNDVIDDDLETIINEEINLLFKGEYTAQQCADMIQSRASIYISERS